MVVAPSSSKQHTRGPTAHEEELWCAQGMEAERRPR
jgi:hypothetical protein